MNGLIPTEVLNPAFIFHIKFSARNHFDHFVNSQISAGHYKNVSEVIRTKLRFLEEGKIIALKKAIKKGIDSTVLHTILSLKYLREFKARNRIMKIGKLANKAVEEHTKGLKHLQIT